MTILEKFLTFAEGLAPDQRSEVDDFLASIMDSASPEFALTADELGEIDRRLADPNPERIADATIRAKLRQSQH